jgi:hypothetical protein
MAQESTHPPTQMSPSNLPGVQGSRCMRLTPSLPSVSQLSRKYGRLDISQSHGPPQPVRDSFTFSCQALVSLPCIHIDKFPIHVCLNFSNTFRAASVLIALPCYRLHQTQPLNVANRGTEESSGCVKQKSCVRSKEDRYAEIIKN